MPDSIDLHDLRSLPIEQLIRVADILIEAMPFIRTFRGSTVVIKYGGAAMVKQELKEAVIRDIILMHDVGSRPIVVHGGGKEITSLMDRLGLKARFVGGQRVTDAETLDVAEMVLVGKINSEITSALTRGGAPAVGLSGKDGGLLVAEKLLEPGPTGEPGADLGYVGTVKQVNPAILDALRDKGYVPVISPIGVGEDGQGYNINADTVALEVARAAGARKLIFLTDTPGVLRDPADPRTVIPTIAEDEIEDMIAKGVVSGGMIPKLRSARRALEVCRKVHILDGRVPHSLLLELFTTRGIGTQIARRDVL